MIDTVIFDAEGVVIDTEPIWDKGQVEFLGRRGLAYDRASLKPLLTGTSVADGVRIMQRLYGFGGDPDVLATERMDIIRELLRRETAFIPGFTPFFERIRPAYKTCIATAMDDALFALVDAKLDLRRRFAGHIFTIKDVGFKAKPHPDIFLHAAARLDAAPARCLVIEDSPLGIEAAHRGGMRAIGITTTYPRDVLAQADMVVGAFDEINPATWGEDPDAAQ